MSSNSFTWVTEGGDLGTADWGCLAGRCAILISWDWKVNPRIAITGTYPKTWSVLCLTVLSFVLKLLSVEWLVWWLQQWRWTSRGWGWIHWRFYTSSDARGCGACWRATGDDQPATSWFYQQRQHWGAGDAVGWGNDESARRCCRNGGRAGISSHGMRSCNQIATFVYWFVDISATAVLFSFLQSDFCTPVDGKELVMDMRKLAGPLISVHQIVLLFSFVTFEFIQGQLSYACCICCFLCASCKHCQ